MTETGVRSEFSHHGISSRVHQKRADRVHQALDPILVAGPWMVAGGIVYSAVRAMAKRRQ